MNAPKQLHEQWQNVLLKTEGNLRFGPVALCTVPVSFSSSSLTTSLSTPKQIDVHRTATTAGKRESECLHANLDPLILSLLRTPLAEIRHL